MKTPLDYLALFIAFAPASALLAVLLCGGMPRLNRWLDRLFTRRMGNRYRDESWHQKHPGARLRERLRR